MSQSVSVSSFVQSQSQKGSHLSSQYMTRSIVCVILPHGDCVEFSESERTIHHIYTIIKQTSACTCSVAIHSSSMCPHLSLDVGASLVVEQQRAYSHSLQASSVHVH